MQAHRHIEGSMAYTLVKTIKLLSEQTAEGIATSLTQKLFNYKIGNLATRE